MQIQIHKYERIWLICGALILIIFLGILAVSAFLYGQKPPSHEETIRLEQAASTPPFNKPGLRKIGPNEYEAVMTGFSFGYQPNALTVPRGAKVHFILTTTDIVHGFAIPKTNVNVMLIPGYVSKITQTFDKPGEYLILCNEYCGVGHQLMAATLTVK